MGRFDGKTALVTGASRGIGLAVAQRLADDGARVIITARNPETLAEAATSLGSALWVAGKADDADHRAEVLDLVKREFGALDFFVNNAGTNPAYGALLDIERPRHGQDPQHQPHRGTRLDPRGGAAGYERRRVDREHRLHRRAHPGAGHRLLRRLEGSAHRAHVAARPRAGSGRARERGVAPAVIKTSFARALYEGREEEVIKGYPLGRLGEPEDVGGVVAFLLSRDAAWITGQTIVIDGGGSLRPVA